MSFYARFLVVAFALVMLAPEMTLAKSKSGKKSKSEPILFEPFLTSETADYEIVNMEDEKIDKGAFSTIGVGFRAGYDSRFLFVGAEALYTFPSLKSDMDLDSATREANPLADDNGENYGATIKLKLGPLHVFGTAYWDSKMEGRIENSDVSMPDATYEYLGIGARIGVELNVAAGLTVGAGYSSYTYNRYSLDRNVNSLTAAKEAAREDLDITGSFITVNYAVTLDPGK